MTGNDVDVSAFIGDLNSGVLEQKLAHVRQEKIAMGNSSLFK